MKTHELQAICELILVHIISVRFLIQILTDKQHGITIRSLREQQIIMNLKNVSKERV